MNTPVLITKPNVVERHNNVVEVEQLLNCVNDKCDGTMNYSNLVTMIQGKVQYTHICTKCRQTGFVRGERYPKKVYKPSGTTPAMDLSMFQLPKEKSSVKA